MIATRSELNRPKPDGGEVFLFTTRSGLEVNAYDNIWRLLPNTWKGSKIGIEWLHSAEMSEEHKRLILEVFIFYARTKAASTTASVVANTKPFLLDGIPSLKRINQLWSGLRTNQKKGLNQFFLTLVKHGHKSFDEYHFFTSKNLDKGTPRTLDPRKGALTDIEFDSLAKSINVRLAALNCDSNRDLGFYQSEKGFNELRNVITSKLLISIVRRPVQISVLKWSDLIPVGARYEDVEESPEFVIGTVGSLSLQLRVFIAKSKRNLGPREFPEKYSLNLSENLSQEMVRYKGIYMHGVKQWLESCGIREGHASLLKVMNNMPMFASNTLFEIRLSSIEMIQKIFTKYSTAYHASESSITAAIRNVSFSSERVTNGNATSNRVRHTVMTRGAQDGLPAIQLARLTGVTVPAARHYIDLDYSARRLIDIQYIGNQYLSQLFNPPITELNEEEYIVDSRFNPVGGVETKSTCATCSTSIGKPLGCYGCPNFRPILEADHRAVLVAAEDKRVINRNALVNPIHTRSIEKLEKQIQWLKYTIAFCDEIISLRSSIDAK